MVLGPSLLRRGVKALAESVLPERRSSGLSALTADLYIGRIDEMRRGGLLIGEVFTAWS
jgi:hypothetical protein